MLTVLLFTTIQSATADTTTPNENTPKSVVLGGGCFWCMEAIFERIKGVLDVESGYAGGSKETANYKTVSTGNTKHAEVVRVKYDPKLLTYQDVLTIFFHLHDPTTLNRQGNDRGPQYRSVVFYADESEQEEAKAIIKGLISEALWPDPIVTELSPLEEFYPAEQYHQDYYNANKTQPYCSAVIGPKIQKLKKLFGDRYQAIP